MAYDPRRVEELTRELLLAFGEDPDREGLLKTPQRVARSYAEILSGIDQDPAQHLQTVFQVGTDELVVVRDIEFHSMCEHHLLPFFGVAHVAYLPSEGRVTGLSKLARCVDGYARRPQVQERMTRQIADALIDVLGARGAAVIIEAEHMCMTLRGIQKAGARTITTSFLGELGSSSWRQEILTLVKS